MHFVEPTGPRYVFKLRYVLLAVVSMYLSGCAGSTLFTSYPNKISPLITSIQTRQPIPIDSCLIEECKSSNLILFNMERGRLAQIQGSIDTSISDFNASMQRMKEDSEKAKISLSDIGSDISAAAVNDNAIPYQGDGYEKVMLHHYQALNYLRKNDIENAGVEVRRANAEQEDSLKLHEEEIEKVQKDAEDKKIGNNALNIPAVTKQYAQLDELAGSVKNSFQNAYTFYMSGFIHEIMSEPNDAYIDYKKALEIYPNNSILQKDVLRLASSLKMSEELDALKLRFDVPVKEINSNECELLVLFEEGFVPKKHEVKIPLPIPQVGLMAAAFPIYHIGKDRSFPLSIKVDNSESLGSTENICDFRALSVKALKEKIPVMVTRQLIRLVVKGAATKLAKEKGGAFGELGMSLYNLATENADLRSWNTLPANAQILRASVAAGAHKLTLNQNANSSTSSIDINVQPGTKTILHVVQAGQQFYTTVMTFKNSDQPHITPAASTVNAPPIDAPSNVAPPTAPPIIDTPTTNTPSNFPPPTVAPAIDAPSDAAPSIKAPDTNQLENI